MLSNVNIPRVETVGYKAFGDCISLKNLRISGDIVSMAFSGCRNLEKLECIGRYEAKSNGKFELYPASFRGLICSGCENLKNLSLNARSLNASFKDLPNLESVEITTEGSRFLEQPTAIAVQAFSGCTKLEKVLLSARINRIHEDAFKGCTSLKSVEIPDTIETIGKNAFDGCTNIKYVLLEGSHINKAEGYGDLFYNNAIARGEPGAAVYVTQSAYNSTAFQWEGVPENVVHFIPTLSGPKVQASFEDGAVKLSWNAVDGADGYNVIRTSAGVEDQVVAENVTGATYTDSDVTSTRNYGYSAQALAYYNKNAEPDDPFGGIQVKTAGGTVYVSTWGKEVRHNGVVNYVSEDGTTSVEIKDKGTYFLKEESGGTSAWYAIENEGQFAKGSRFWVRWLTQKGDPQEFAKYYNMLDANVKSLVDSGKISIFLTGVTDPDGNDYTNLSRNTNFYVQIGEDWDKEDINAVFISQGKDQGVGCEYIDSMMYPGGKGIFAKLNLRHFSPYAVFDELTDEEKSVNNFVQTGDKEKSVNNFVQTGDENDLWSMVGLWTMLMISSFAVLILNKKRSKYE